MAATIEIRRQAKDDTLLFAVTVREDGTQSQHSVTVSPAYAARLADAPERVIEAAFRFLLDRESKESILSRFDIAVIGRYFPEFAHELPRYLAPR